MKRVKVAYITNEQPCVITDRLTVTFCGSGGIMPTTRPELLTHVFPMPSLGSILLGGESNVTACSHLCLRWTYG